MLVRVYLPVSEYGGQSVPACVSQYALQGVPACVSYVMYVHLVQYRTYYMLMNNYVCLHMKHLAMQLRYCSKTTLTGSK